MSFERALVVFAHPDDAEFGVAGTVATWVAEGTEVTYVSVTDGAAGSNAVGATREEVRAVRERELRAAGQVLGVYDIRFLGYPDGMLQVTLDLRRDLTREVRRVRPDVLLSPDPLRIWDERRAYVNHPDHIAVGVACLNVVNPDAPTRLQFPELLDEGLEPFDIPNLWIPSYDGQADTWVDITSTIDKKIEALRCHASQVGPPLSVEQWVRDRARERGEPNGMEYAETFRTFRFEVA